MNFLLKKVKGSPKLKSIFIGTFGWLIKTYMFLCNKIAGVDSNKVTFISFGGKSYSGNAKAVSETLYNSHPKFKIVWLFLNPREKSKKVPNYITSVKVNTLKGFYNLATSKIWVDD